MNASVLVEQNAWPAAFCHDVRLAMEAGEAGAAEIIDGGYVIDDTVRLAYDVTLPRDWTRRLERAVAALVPRLSVFFDVPLSETVGVTCLRYPEGGMYRRHRDRDPRPGSGTEMRLVSMIVWLNSGTTATDRGEFDGGILRLYPDGDDAIAITPVAGTLTAFPAEWPHEVTPVTRGTRDAVVDWVY